MIKWVPVEEKDTSPLRWITLEKDGWHITFKTSRQEKWGGTRGASVDYQLHGCGGESGSYRVLEGSTNHQVFDELVEDYQAEGWQECQPSLQFRVVIIKGKGCGRQRKKHVAYDALPYVYGGYH